MSRLGSQVRLLAFPRLMPPPSPAPPRALSRPHHPRDAWRGALPALQIVCFTSPFALSGGGGTCVRPSQTRPGRTPPPPHLCPLDGPKGRHASVLAQNQIHHPAATDML